MKPTWPQVHHAVERAATIRRRRYQEDDQYSHYTPAALLEQVCGVEGTPYDQGDGWWLVGKVVDVIAHVELEVLCRPGETIRMREISRDEPLEEPGTAYDPSVYRPWRTLSQIARDAERGGSG